MLRHKNINRICWAVLAMTLVIGILFTVAGSMNWIEADISMGYEKKLFDTSRVHTIDIAMDDWEGFLETCTSEEYAACTIVIDGEKYANVGIRGKGNTSLTQVAAYGNDRYSFKVEFDKYSKGSSYYGLDKLSLNNLISDNTYMKDYLSYSMMNYMGIPSSLCSYVYITVNGEDWGLYLAVEGVEDGFLQRNYGADYGALYKPDSMSFGGGRGNGAGFDITDFITDFSGGADGGLRFPEDFDFSSMQGGGGNPSSEGETDSDAAMTPDFDSSAMAGGRGNGGGGFGMESSDVQLQYIDDDPDSYSNIFDNAKTEITDGDKTRLIASLKQLSEGENIEEIVDMDAVIRYLVAHNFVCNYDSYTGSMVHNYYLYEEDGVLSMIPWDYNLAFGAMNNMGMGSSDASGATSDVNAPIDSPVSSGTLESRPMVAWIFADDSYTERYHQYYEEFIEAYFVSGYFETLLDETTKLISPYVQTDPTAFCTYEEFLTGVETLREFCLLRAESISGQLDGTIPSTEEGQSEDNAPLIDASHISISDMGQFSAGGDFGGGRSGQGQRSENGPMIGDGEERSNAGAPGTDATGFGQNAMPDEAAPSVAPSDGEDSGAAASDGLNAADVQTTGSGSNEIKLTTLSSTGDSIQGAAPSSDGSEDPSGAQQPDDETNIGAANGEGDSTDRGEALPSAGQEGNMSQGGFGGGAMPEGMDDLTALLGGADAGGSATDAEQWILLGASVCVLLVGLLIAFKFRR